MRPNLLRSALVAGVVSAALVAACLRRETTTRAESRAANVAPDAPSTPPVADVAPLPELPCFDTAEPPLPLDDPPLPPRRLSGKVIFEDGRPAPRACVYDLFGSIEFPGEAAEDGTFTADVEPGKHALVAQAGEDGYLRGCTWVTVPEDGIVPDVTISLPRVRPYWASVRAVEADGRPAANVRVAGRRTDPEGRARLEFCNCDGPVDLTLVEDGLVGITAKATVAVGEHDPGPETVVELPPLRSVRIVVTGPGGAAVPLASIRNIAVGVGNGSIDLPVVDGFHRLAYRCWPEGRVGLYVSADGFAYWCGTLRKPGEWAEVQLDLPATIVGRLLDENGVPVAGREMSCNGDATTDALGRFRFEGVVPRWENEIRVFRRPERPGSWSYLVRFPLGVGPGEIRDVGDLRLPRLALTRGRVTDRAGRPLAGATVKACGGPLRFGGETESGPDGGFQLELPASQRWDFRVTRRGYCTVVAEGCEAGGNTELEMPTEGRVRVRTTKSYGDAWAQLGEHRIDLKCRKGQLLGLPAGPVRVHLTESGEVVSTREIDVVPGRIVDVDFP